jgi:Fur family ferric uptake transcriptional regulator
MSCEGKLKENGYRLTPQRIMVIDAIHSTDQHVSAEEIYEKVRVRYPSANISTIYRTVELLKKLDLVNEIDLGDGRVRYHHVEKGHHHHLVCNRCGNVIALPESTLLPLIEVLDRDYHFQADLRHLAVFGICANCLSDTSKVREEKDNGRKRVQKVKHTP